MRNTTILLATLFAMFAGRAEAQVDTRNPTTARDFYERGLKRQDAEQLQAAVEDFQRAVELDPGYFSAQFTLSSVYAELKDYRAAVDALAKSLKARPNDYSALFNSGLYHEYLGNYDRAIAHYTHATAEAADIDLTYYGSSVDEARAHAYHYRGRIYQWHKNDHLQAVDDYTAALRLDPKMEMVQYRRARAYHELKKYAPAHADFAAAYDRDPDDPNLLNAWAWQLATCPEAKYRDGPLALKLARKTKDRNTLAAAYAEIGEFDRAVAAQKRALQQLEDLPKPKNEQAAKRRRERTQQMQTQLAAYEARRPYRDEE